MPDPVTSAATPPAAPPVAPPATAPAAPVAPVTPAAPPSPEVPKAEFAPKSLISGPVDVQINVPEGFKFDPKQLDTVKALFKESGLDSPKAQKIADYYFGLQKTAVEQQKEQVLKWGEESKADPEIGGAKFEQTVNDAKRAISRFGSKELVDMLDATGLGNHKAVLSTLARIGKMIAEDKASIGPAGPGVDQKGKDLAALMYPTMQKKT